MRMRKTCPECDGWGTTGRMVVFGGVGAHVQGTCPTCNGKCYVIEGWVERHKRLKAEQEAKQAEKS